jgi:hypothetical protein
VILRHQLFQGNMDERRKTPLFAAHHSGRLSSLHNDIFL